MRLEKNIMKGITGSMVDTYNLLSDDWSEIIDLGMCCICDHLHELGYLECHSIPIIENDKFTGRFRKYFKHAE